LVLGAKPEAQYFLLISQDVITNDHSKISTLEENRYAEKVCKANAVSSKTQAQNQKKHRHPKGQAVLL